MRPRFLQEPAALKSLQCPLSFLSCCLCVCPSLLPYMSHASLCAALCPGTTAPPLLSCRRWLQRQGSRAWTTSSQQQCPAPSCEWCRTDTLGRGWGGGVGADTQRGVLWGQGGYRLLPSSQQQCMSLAATCAALLCCCCWPACLCCAVLPPRRPDAMEMGRYTDGMGESEFLAFFK